MRATVAALFLFGLAGACSSSDTDSTTTHVSTTGPASAETSETSTGTADRASAGGAPDDPQLLRLATAAGEGNPTDAIPPPADDQAAAVDWYRNGGAAAVTLVTATEPLWRGGRTTCNDVALTLDAAATPEETLAATTDGPDGTSNQILAGLHALTIETLSRCDTPDEFESALAEFAWQWSVAAARLDELRVPR